MQSFIDVYGFLMVSMTLQALLALSLYLPLMTGQLSLASAGFYALGGYIAAIMSTTVFPPTAQGEVFPLPYLLIEMLLAAVACAVLAIIIGVPALRLRGIYLALATIAFVEVLRVVSLNLPITGQAIGIFGVPQPFQGIGYLVITLPLLLLSMLFVYRLERSRFGRAFAALREDELAATAMGINPTFNKVLAFTLGAILAGVVGAVSAHLLNTWNARQGTFDVSVLVLAYVIIGGSRTFLGPVMGGLLLTALPEVLRSIANTNSGGANALEFLVEGRWIIYGVLIAVSTLFFPQGLITPQLLKRFRRKPAQSVSSVKDG